MIDDKRVMLKKSTVSYRETQKCRKLGEWMDEEDKEEPENNKKEPRNEK